MHNPSPHIDNMSSRKQAHVSMKQIKIEAAQNNKLCSIKQ